MATDTITLQEKDAAGNLSAPVTVDINWTTPPPPASTKPLVGMAYQGNGDVSGLEAGYGTAIGVHRTYWNLGSASVASSIATIKADLTAGRVPWVSYKLVSPMTWADAAAGGADAAIKALAAQLAALNKTVWVAIHHEPEGDGTLSDWVAMQNRLLPMFPPNVKIWIVLTGWDTFFSGNAAYSLASLYPTVAKPNIGLDKYNNYGDDKHPGKGWTEMKETYDLVAPEAKKRGVQWGIAETGYTDSGAVKDVEWLTRAYDDMANHTVQPGIGLAYFNSNLNSIGTWPLNAVKTPVFTKILKKSKS